MNSKTLRQEDKLRSHYIVLLANQMDPVQFQILDPHNEKPTPASKQVKAAAPQPPRALAEGELQESTGVGRVDLSSYNSTPDRRRVIH